MPSQYPSETDFSELRRRAAQVVREWHDDNLTADTVGFLADLLAELDERDAGIVR